MKTIGTTEYIRQQQVGQFRRHQDGKEPFAHVDGQKLDSAGVKERSVYVNDEKVDTLEKEITSADFPKLFDAEVGAKFVTENVTKNNKEEEVAVQYDKSAKVQTETKQQRLVDQWA